MRRRGRPIHRLQPPLVLAVALAMSAAPSNAADEETIEELVTRVGRARWTTGNTAELLVDPRSAWRARVELAESAQHHLLVSVFSWHNDGYGKAYRRTLEEIMTQRSDDGIELAVRVLADASALNLFDQAFVDLEDHGAKVRGFNRSSWGLTPLYDLRMHDKMVIADGRTAIVGGRNVSDLYFDPARWWLDLGVRIAGPVVADLQMIFLKSWELTRFNRSFRRYVLPQEMLVDELRTFWTTGRFPNGRSPLEPYMTTDYFPPSTSTAGALRVAVLYDNPLIRRRAATVDLVAALAGRAEHSIDLMTPFPNFPPELTEALAGAAVRGVRVRLFVNGRDAAIRGGPFRLAGYPTLVRLMEAGAEVWAWAANGDHAAAAVAADCDPDLTPPIALHGKMARFDDELSIVTSSNFNIRSAYYNTEAGVVVLDREFNRSLEDLVEGLIANDRRAFRCGDPSTDLAGSPLLRRLDAGDAARMRDELRGKQGFLDRWGVAW